MALHFLNTEYQELMFKQANLIAKGTSKMHANHIITNIFVRGQEHAKYQHDPLESEESKIAKLAAVLDGLALTICPLFCSLIPIAP